MCGGGGDKGSIKKGRRTAGLGRGSRGTIQSLTSPRLPLVFLRGEEGNLKMSTSILQASEASPPHLFPICCKKSTTTVPPPPLPPAASLPRGAGLISLSDASVCNSKLTGEKRKETLLCREKPAKHIVQDAFTSCTLRSPHRTQRSEPRATYA